MALFVNIEKTLGNFHLKVNFETDNEIMSILGASGCGKSMTLKCIAGIETPDKGQIILNGVTLFDSDKKINIAPQKRKVGYLFQQYALFPNMNVEQNIACAIKDKKNKKSIVKEYMKAMNLEGMEKKKPHQLSGGQQQRVALARILANEPEVMLLDEPFSALDAHLRFQLEREVYDIIRSFAKPVILVSHDRDEVYRLSNRITIMKDGIMETAGNKKDVFKDPKTRSSAILTGCKNVIEVDRLDETHVYIPTWDMKLMISKVSHEINYVGIRMHDIHMYKEQDHNVFTCDVINEIENPFSYIIALCPINSPLKTALYAEFGKEEWRLNRNKTIQIAIDKKDILLLEE